MGFYCFAIIDMDLIIHSHELGYVSISEKSPAMPSDNKPGKSVEMELHGKINGVFYWRMVHCHGYQRAM